MLPRSPSFTVVSPDAIQIAGTIGTGLFLGSGNALRGAGPLGALIAYALVGTTAYAYVRVDLSFVVASLTVYQVTMFRCRNDYTCPHIWDFPALWYISPFTSLSAPSNGYITAGRWVDPSLGFAVGWVSALVFDSEMVSHDKERIIFTRMRKSS